MIYVKSYTNGSYSEPIKTIVAGSERIALDNGDYLDLTLRGDDVFLVDNDKYIDCFGRYYNIKSLRMYIIDGIPHADVACESVINMYNAWVLYSAYGQAGMSAGLSYWLQYYPAHPKPPANTYGLDRFSFGETDSAYADSNQLQMYLTASSSSPKTGRDVLWEYCKRTLVCSDIEIIGWTWNCWKHRGTTDRINLVGTGMISDIQATTDYRDGGTSYAVTVFKNPGLSVGDEVRIKLDPLNIDVNTRIMATERNPYDPDRIVIEVGDYVPDVKDILVNKLYLQ